MLTLDKPQLDEATLVIASLPPQCESLLEGVHRCTGRGYAVVRFKAHGCGRDGKGVVLCKACLDWIAGGGIGCSHCDLPCPHGELFIVSEVKL